MAAGIADLPGVTCFGGRAWCIPARSSPPKGPEIAQGIAALSKEPARSRIGPMPPVISPNSLATVGGLDKRLRRRKLQVDFQQIQPVVEQIKELLAADWL